MPRLRFPLADAYASLDPPEATLLLEPTPLSQLINLRAQAETASKTENLFDKRVGGWLSWEEVQQARVKAEERLAAHAGDAAGHRAKLRDAAAISLLSLIPPDRVGLIRCAPPARAGLPATSTSVPSP